MSYLTEASRLDACFSIDYAQARSRFLAATHGLPGESFICPAVGKAGETLAIDIAWQGSTRARNLLVLSSGCHGVEGFCGSAIQLACLQNTRLAADLARDNLAILHIHALNPYGFSHIGRCTHENIDLNRNFLDFKQALPQNPGYAALHPVLHCDTWPPDEKNTAAIIALIGTMGIAQLQATVEVGQYQFADGVFYGGQAASWNNQALHQILRKYAASMANIAWLDIHTGLGEHGACETAIFAQSDAPTLQRAHQWWNPEGDIDIVSDVAGTSISAVCHGPMWHVIADTCPQANYAGLTLEFGTVPVLDVFNALRAEQWRRRQTHLPDALQAAIDSQIKQAFLCDSMQWRECVMAHSWQMIGRSLAALARW